MGHQECHCNWGFSGKVASKVFMKLMWLLHLIALSEEENKWDWCIIWIFPERSESTVEIFLSNQFFSYSEHFEQNVVYINIEVNTCKNFLNICCKPFSCHIKKKQLWQKYWVHNLHFFMFSLWSWTLINLGFLVILMHGVR